jgi:ribosomal protein S18 acetylase RimI-like enzyme
MTFMQRILPPLLLVVTWAAMTLVTLIWPLGEPFAAPLRLVGGVLSALGFLLSVKGAKIFRLWIAPAARGVGLARRLMTTAEQAAKSLGITTLRLDTNSTLFETVGLYRAMSWVEIDRFNNDPYPDLFFEKHL